MFKCWIDNSVMRKIYEESMRLFPLETGGVLMGYRTLNGDIVIVDVIGPGPDSKHEPYSFVCDSKWQNKEVGYIFKKYEGQITYIGDWHTHPNNPTNLSAMDVTALKTIANSPDAYCPEPIMLVMGFRCDVIDVFKYPKTNESLRVKKFDFAGIHA